MKANPIQYDTPIAPRKLKLLVTVVNREKAEFYMDYIEFCPKEVYDNPQTPEDIW